MSTDLSFGTIPQSYREIYDLLSPSGDGVDKELMKLLLTQSQISNVVFKEIWDMCCAAQGLVTRTSVYKTLALIGLAQNGKVPSEKLLENFAGREFPTPDIGDISVIKQYIKSSKSVNSAMTPSYSDITRIDTITIDLAPEKKGLFLKHSEYLVSSRKHGTTVKRRYNDFVAFHELLLARFPYRLIPRLPPKKIVSDSHFLESRRRALQRWLTLVARHPILSESSLTLFFLNDNGSEHQHRIKETFKRQPDEFTTSELAEKAKELLPSNTQTEFSAAREQISNILNGVRRLHQICERGVSRSRALAIDTQELSAQLNELAMETHGHSYWATGGNTVWADIKKGFAIISKEFTSLSHSAVQTAVREEDAVCDRLALLSDALAAHTALCERLERGVLNDHQRALQQMLSLKKRQIQGVIKGTDAESVDQLESRMIQQESVISNMELRNAFSLHCVHMETQLIHVYLEILASVFNTMVAVQVQSHTELADVWKLIQPTVVKYLPEKSKSQ